MSEPTDEELQAMLKARPTRLLVSRACKSCHYTWTAPSTMGACPRCHSIDVVNGNQRINGLKTL